MPPILQSEKANVYRLIINAYKKISHTVIIRLNDTYIRLFLLSFYCNISLMNIFNRCIISYVMQHKEQVSSLFYEIRGAITFHKY